MSLYSMIKIMVKFSSIGEEEKRTARKETRADSSI